MQKIILVTLFTMSPAFFCASSSSNRLYHSSWLEALVQQPQRAKNSAAESELPSVRAISQAVEANNQKSLTDLEVKQLERGCSITRACMTYRIKGERK
jgi:hypothetical protein